MSTNPYSPPNAELVIDRPLPDIPAEVLKQIRQAWIAGAVSAGITLLVTLFAISGNSILGFDVWNLVDVGFILALTFGIYKKSRVCATLMLVYFVGSKILMVMDGNASSGMLWSVIFVYLYVQGVRGTFAYHTLIKQ